MVKESLILSGKGHQSSRGEREFGMIKQGSIGKQTSGHSRPIFSQNIYSTPMVILSSTGLVNKNPGGNVVILYIKSPNLIYIVDHTHH